MSAIGYFRLYHGCEDLKESFSIKYIYYSSEVDEWCLVFMNGESEEINYCPFCGYDLHIDSEKFVGHIE